MFAVSSRRLRRRLSAPSSGSARLRAFQRKRAEQTRAEGERLARERRELRIREKYEQQRQAREELASYEPWGRAGAGAPNPQGVRFSNLRARGIYPEDELKGISLFETCQRWSSPQRRYHQTPLRLREDPQLCYAENLRKSVDNDIRYKQTPNQQQAYKEILDNLVDQRKKAIKEEILQDLEFERKLNALEGPWGKPGPGGKIWRNPRNVGLNFSKSMGWTDNEIFNKIRGDQRRSKRSSLTLPDVKRADDYSNLVALEKENVVPHREKLPQINKHSIKSKNCSSDEKRQVEREKELIQCYGKNGRTKQNSSKQKFVKRLSNGERVEKRIEDIGDSLNDKKLTPEETILRVTGGIELVPLLARRRRVGARTLPSSDVTRPPHESCQWREIRTDDYLRQLKQQMRVKSQQKEESRRNSAESVKQHHATWSSLWGRPGHGAPQLRGRYARSNLAQLLYVPPLTDKIQI
ncbi:uncharacterized protein LOC123693274 [Colias croceus]|uniref:uncharacterized protein LOC123693274 n=1 Tax=Colias crocea TaxID=72248 RepID=UPI001E2803DA|nr:uncharacterized protein LOC123693274 [Colias croceus]